MESLPAPRLEASPVLARRIEDAQVQIARALVRAHKAVFPRQATVFVTLGEGSVHSIAGGKLCAQGLGIESPVRDAELERLIELSAKFQRPVEVLVCGLGDPTLPGRLGSLGFRESGREICMGRALARTDRDWAPTRGFSIQGILPSEHLLWARTIAHTSAAEPSPATLEPLLARVASDSFLGFFARTGHEVVAAGGIQSVGDVACAGPHATTPRLRKQGLQRLLLAHGVSLAAERGQTLFCLFAPGASSSLRNAEREGFHSLYQRVAFTRNRA